METKTAVIFYTLSGNSKLAAEYIANKYNSKLIALLENGKRKGLIGFLKGGYQALKKKQMKLIGTPWKNIETYEHIFIIFPIWANNINPAINTLLQHSDFNNKHISIITLQASPDINSTQNVRDELSEIIRHKGGFISDTYGITASTKTTDAEIINQLNKNLKI